jgi:hypothetical protein
MTAMRQLQRECCSAARVYPARARILLAYQSDPSTYAVGVNHQTVKRCHACAVRLGALAALDDSPRPDKAL